MSTNGKKVGVYAFSGVLIALLIIASISISGIRFPFFTPSQPVLDTGTLVVILTDAPVNLTHLNVTLDSISAHRQGYGNESWVDLEFINDVTEVYFDLLALQDIAMNLSITEIPPGNYTMLKMHVKTANATYANGNTTDLEVPSEHIKVIIHFEVNNGEVTTVLVDMQTDWVSVSQSKKLRPVLKATIIPS